MNAGLRSIAFCFEKFNLVIKDDNLEYYRNNGCQRIWTVIFRTRAAFENSNHSIFVLSENEKLGSETEKMA